MSNNDRLIKQISISMERKISELPNSSSGQCIFKVHDKLRNHNKEAYEPQVLSIGPYHRGKCNLKEMETHKLRYLHELLLRRQEKNAHRYISALMELKDRARNCYAEEISLNENDFVEMLCLDGIFIIEFLRKRNGKLPELPNGDDEIFKMDWLIGTVERDLILFENQIPFFVLDKLFDMTKSDGEDRLIDDGSDGEDSLIDDGEDNLIDLALPVCQVPFDPSIPVSRTSIFATDVIHLLQLRHKISCSFFDAIPNDPENDDDLQPELKSTSQLRQSGIKFERAQSHKTWLDITFKNGKLKIPHLTVDDHTESIFRNLIAFEQYMTGSHSRKFITNYAVFLDHLIDSPRDVEKLRHCKIITNCLGDDEVVATMFNKLVRDVTFGEFCYSKVYEEVNKHANRRWNTWKAHLMKKYFNTPWSVISFLAAVVLLIFTFVQTIFSILAV